MNFSKILNVLTILSIVIFVSYIFKYATENIYNCNTIDIVENDNILPKNIYLLWLQGWENASWLNHQVVASWKINNPTWKIHMIDLVNLPNYVNDIDYIYENNNITPQAKSDIIRLSLLKNHGGVWADATLLCMQPLDHWVYKAVEPAGLWMYHGHSSLLVKEVGPVSWFIISKKNGYMITRWKDECDNYWIENDVTNEYLWLDTLFGGLYYGDGEFNKLWSSAPYLYCDAEGQSHMLTNGRMNSNDANVKKILLEKPPYVVKFWKSWNEIFPDINSEECKNSNGYYAIQMSKRKFQYTHVMT